MDVRAIGGHIPSDLILGLVPPDSHGGDDYVGDTASPNVLGAGLIIDLFQSASNSASRSGLSPDFRLRELKCGIDSIQASVSRAVISSGRNFSPA
jgi:hypothetical protein